MPIPNNDIPYEVQMFFGTLLKEHQEKTKQDSVATTLADMWKAAPNVMQNQQDNEIRRKDSGPDKGQ
jgi:hypothetical protein